jgi:nucleoside-diphosphate-sugar epimerase
MALHSADSLLLVVTGAGGRVCQLLRAASAGAPPGNINLIWCSRVSGFWQDLLAGPLDPCPLGAVVLHFAADLSDHPDAAAKSVAMAEAIGIAARQGRARHVFFASTAAVYAPADHELDEASACRPVNAYGQAKLLAEKACRTAAGTVPVTALRIGNVIGAGALLGPTRSSGPIILDPVPGQVEGPIRSWIAPGELARILHHLTGLAGRCRDLPPVLNLASPGAFGMAELLDAAGLFWRYGPYREAVLPRLSLDLSRLAALDPALGRPTPVDMIADWRSTLAKGVTA